MKPLRMMKIPIRANEWSGECVRTIHGKEMKAFVPVMPSCKMN